jgi:dUTP pyrophosphatase
MNTIDIQYLDSRLGKEFPLPTYSTEGSAGLDLIACNQEPINLHPNSVELIPSGIAIHINNPNYAACILPRSGLGHKKGLILGNSIGLIDSDYQGMIKISCWNRSEEAFSITPGTRIAQLIFILVAQPELNIVQSFEPTERAHGSFGSTGI